MESVPVNGSTSLAECQNELDAAQAAYEAVRRKRNLPGGRIPDFKVAAKSRLDAAKLALQNAEKFIEDQPLGDVSQPPPTAVMQTVLGALSSIHGIPNATLQVKQEMLTTSMAKDVSDDPIDVDADESSTSNVSFPAPNVEVQQMEVDSFSKDNAEIQCTLASSTSDVKTAGDAMQVDDGPDQNSFREKQASFALNSLLGMDIDTAGVQVNDHRNNVGDAAPGEIAAPSIRAHSPPQPGINDVNHLSMGADAAAPADDNSDKIIKTLMDPVPNPIPDPVFKMPTTIPEYLDYKFTFIPVEWDDISTPVIMRLVQEAEDSYKMRREMHIREYEYTDAKRQQNELHRVYEALEELFNDGQIPPRDGRRQLSALENEQQVISVTVLDFQKRYELAKADYDRFMERQNGEEKADKLRKRLLELKGALFLVDDSELVKTRAEYNSVQASLEEIVNKAAATGGTAGKAKGGRKKKSATVKPQGDTGLTPDNDEEKEEEEEEEEEGTVKRERGERGELPYIKADDDGREKIRAEGRRAIQKYLTATTELARQRALNVSLRVGLRRTAREVQEFLPELSYTTKEIALQVHIASSKNCVCRYHTYYRSDSHAEWDRVDRLTGIGYPKRMCSQDNGVFTTRPGHMHCGCGIDEVLLEFFFWKNLTAFSSNPQLSSIAHAMGDREFIPPRLRAFWVHHFKSTTGITVNDLYRRDAQEDGFMTRLTAKSLLFQMNSLNARGFRLALAFQSEEDEKDFNMVVQ